MLYEPISSTAQTLAYVRACGGLESPLFVKEIARASGAKEATRKFYRRDDFDVDLKRMKKLYPWAILRTEALRAATGKSGIRQVMELASGLSPAGLLSINRVGPIGTFWGPVIDKYLETDLPQIVMGKEQIVTEVMRPYMPPEELMFAPLNALDGRQMFAVALRHFSQGPLAVVHEGLFLYLTHEEKLRVARNIADTLLVFGGAWFTTDVALKKNLEAAFNANEYSKRMRQVMAENTGRDMVECAFKSYDEAEELFGKAGFSVQRGRQLDYEPLTLIRVLHRQEKHEHLEHQQLWTMTLAK